MALDYVINWDQPKLVGLGRTYTETGSSNKSTWHINYRLGYSGSKGQVRIYPTTLAYYESSSTKGYAEAYVQFNVVVGSHKTSSTPYYVKTFGSWPKGSENQATLNSGYETDPNRETIYLSDIFTSANKTVSTLDITYGDSQNPAHIECISASNAGGTTNKNQYQGNDTLARIGTITLDAPPEVDSWTSINDKPYAGYGTYTVQLTNIAAQYGGDITSITLTVGNDTTTKTYAASSIQSDSISVTTTKSGSFTPSCIITDSRGQTKSLHLQNIVINPYVNNVSNVSIQRINSSTFKSDDEGTNAVLKATFNYSSFSGSTLSAPTVKIGTSNATITWYPAWTASGGFSGTAISSWSSVADGTTLYGKITNTLSSNSAYTINITPNTSKGAGTLTSITLPKSFYLLVGRPGGHGLGIGKKPEGDYLDVDLDGYFNNLLVVKNLVGEIKAYAGSTVPTGWLLCDGREVAVSSYPLLYAAIGNLWGTPSDSNHFVLPNLNGKIPVGYDSTDTDFDTVGESGGVKTHTHTTGDFTLGADHIPAHTHGAKLTNGSIRLFKGNQVTTASGSISFSSMTKRQYKDEGTSSNSWQTATFALNHTHASVGGGQAHNHGATGDGSNLQPYAVVKYIICAA